ncbi:hypothetical protein BDA96_02G150600 [Sorghum bicolor]|uniref:Uncharacterized protein n=2 Tax=Sorghum bicolor TaxID=4558 RepID=A0A1B6QB95_SORBI|nr:hypothetical protein BDA96_02G150600 [Sorghum bicolor]KXG35192.1 hypothetical protein SORBI_3002G144600 [Sorghum bicolor]
MHKAAQEISHRGANLVLPDNANGFFFRSPHHYPGDGLIQSQECAIFSLPNNASGFIPRSLHQNPGGGSMQSNQQKDWRPNTGGSVAAQHLHNLYQPGFMFGYNAQQQIPFMQTEAIPSSMLMQSGMSAHYNHMLSPGPMNSCEGSFQKLLRNVSSPNCNLQQMQPQVASTKQTTDQMPDVRACANSTHRTDNIDQNERLILSMMRMTIQNVE